jgi:hypothetical protein
VSRFFTIEWPAIFKCTVNGGKPNKLKAAFKPNTLFEIAVRDGRKFTIKVADKEEAESFASLLNSRLFFGKTYKDMLNSNAYRFKLEGPAG